MDDENVLDFNFWPSFADLMLALVLILMLILFLVAAVLSAGAVDLSNVEKRQQDMIDTIAGVYRGKAQRISESSFGISITNPNVYDIEIRNEPTLQQITFSDKILFDLNKYNLNESGKDALKVVGQALKKQLESIREIQIQGHADNIPTRYESNTYLGAMRALQVFYFLQNDVGINPIEHMMSATSYGEFKPVQRSEEDSQYNEQKLIRHNETPEKRNRNRRIELLLFYRL